MSFCFLKPAFTEIYKTKGIYFYSVFLLYFWFENNFYINYVTPVYYFRRIISKYKWGMFSISTLLYVFGCFSLLRLFKTGSYYVAQNCKAVICNVPVSAPHRCMPPYLALSNLIILTEAV